METEAAEDSEEEAGLAAEEAADLEATEDLEEVRTEKTEAQDLAVETGAAEEADLAGRIEERAAEDFMEDFKKKKLFL